MSHLSSICVSIDDAVRTRHSIVILMYFLYSSNCVFVELRFSSYVSVALRYVTLHSYTIHTHTHTLTPTHTHTLFNIVLDRPCKCIWYIWMATTAAVPRSFVFVFIFFLVLVLVLSCVIDNHKSNAELSCQLSLLYCTNFNLLFNAFELRFHLRNNKFNK